MPFLVAFESVRNFRQFLDFKSATPFMNTVKPKYSADYEFPELGEEEDMVIFNLRKNEYQSGEHYLIDYKTKEVVTMREFVLQELIQGKERDK
jgi:hypothetical protein